MKNNLKHYRIASGLTPKQLSVLLCMTVHSYIGMEQERRSILPENSVMLARIYCIPETAIVGDCENIDYTEILRLSALDEEERFEHAFVNLTGEKRQKFYLSQIRKTRDLIIDQLTDDKKSQMTSSS